MPTYTFFCEHCNKKYEVFRTIREYHDKIPCEFCGSSEAVHRLYVEDASTLTASVRKMDCELKTVGDLAKRNTDRLSNDEKEHLRTKHNSYKDNKPDAPLPKGVSRMQKPKTKTKWV